MMVMMMRKLIVALAAGAVPGFAGRMDDRRLDRHGELAGRAEVLRVRRFQGDGTAATASISWKGPASRTAEGYKLRRELEVEADGGVLIDAEDRELFWFAESAEEIWQSILTWHERNGTPLLLPCTAP